MKTTRLMALALAGMLAACAEKPTPAAVAAAPPPVAATAPPVPLAASAPPPVMDQAAIATAMRNLKALGYGGGKSPDMSDAAFQRAILAFEKDQGLAEDGRLTLALAEKLRLVRAQLLKAPAPDNNRSAVFLYNDGAVRRQALGLVALPKGLVADAPANFLLPLRPGAQGSYQLGNRAKDGSFKPLMTVACQAGRIAQTDLPLGVMDTIAVDCRGDAPNAPQWHSLYSPQLGIVLEQGTAAEMRDLVAIRPLTDNWPSAARTGLDWALTHALDTPAVATPVEWSSTAVAPHFEIKASSKISGAEAGLSGRYAAQSCRRFEIAQTGTPASRFPGIACQSAAGAWSLPGTPIQLAAPANGIGASAPSAALRSAQN